jgi:hypothetical protein
MGMERQYIERLDGPPYGDANGHFSLYERKKGMTRTKN